MNCASSCGDRTLTSKPAVARTRLLLPCAYINRSQMEQVDLSPTVEILSSSSTERCPVTWKGIEKRTCCSFNNLTNTSTPCANSKVNLWLKSCSNVNNTDMESKVTDISSLKCGKLDGTLLSVDHSKRRNNNILIRHDYDKDAFPCVSDFPYRNEMVYYSERLFNDSPVKHAHSKLRNFPNINGVHNSLGENDVIVIDSDESVKRSSTMAKKFCSNFKNEHENDSKRCVSSQSQAVKVPQRKLKHRSISINELPLSPESQKKNELCSYLQLMNMNSTDREIRNAIQQRRSTRVKNLILLSEKRKLEQKLLTEAKEKETKLMGLTLDEIIGTFETEEENNLACKSFAELNIDFSSSYKNDVELSEKVKYNGTVCNVYFNINTLPKTLLENITDFDDAMKDFIETEQIIIKEKPKNKEAIDDKVNQLNTIKKSSKLSQSGKTCLKMSAVWKQLLSPQKIRKYRRLRSNLKLQNVGVKNLMLKDQSLKHRKKREALRRRRLVSDHVKSQDLNTHSDSGFAGTKEAVTDKVVRNGKLEVSLKDKARGKILRNRRVIETFKESPVLLSNKRNSVKKHKRIELRRAIKGRTPHKDLSAIQQISKERSLKRQTSNNQNCRNSHRESQSLPKSVQAFKEKSFCVIDLSHAKSPTSPESLLDHDYTSKIEIDKNYIMNVIVGDAFKVNNVEEKIVTQSKLPAGTCNNDADGNVNMMAKEVLEDIIGVRPAAVKSPNPNVTLDHRQEVTQAELKRQPETNVATERESIQNKLHLSPIEFKYTFNTDFSLGTSDNDSQIFSNKINLTVNDKPPINIFDDSEYSRSPSTTVSGADMSMKVVSNTNSPKHGPSRGQSIPFVRLGTSPNVHDDLHVVNVHSKADFIPLNTSLEPKPLHRNLTYCKRKAWPRNADFNSDCSNHTCDEESPSGLRHKNERKSYSVRISESDGRIHNAFYLDFNLIIVQEQVVSFWSQSALGNMLSAQNMWISKGAVQRLVADGNCVFKKSSHTVISLENSVAYVELWIKEHKSEKRERPVADIFATIYFWKHRHGGPYKKVLQLENINGFACDVQYAVLRNSRHIIVSWCETCDDVRKTVIHSYILADDYQTVLRIKEMGSVSHYVASLHNIEDSDLLVMGCGDHKLSLWNVEYCYLVATIEINDIRSFADTLWVKCDRGYLFTLQLYKAEKLFKLIAINGINHSWKRLQAFSFPSGYNGLRGVCVDNNILAAFYENGVICWNIQTGESVIEEMCSETVHIPSEKHVIMLTMPNRVLVRHALSHFITNYDV